MGDQAADVSASEDLQVQYVDTTVPATTIQIRTAAEVGGELAGEALMLTQHETYLLAAMTWYRLGDVTGVAVAEQKKGVCEALVRAATDLAERDGATLIAIVGGPEDLIASGFSLNGSMWLRPAGSRG